MARKVTAPSAASGAEAEWLTLAADLDARVQAAKARLRAALLAGEQTATLRGEIAGIEGRSAEVGKARSAAAAELLEQAAAELEATALAMAESLAIRLAAMIAALQPPPAPI
jgi:hypothetical protein